MLRVLYGTDEAVPEALALRAGRLTTRLRGTRLGPIEVDGTEVWHGVDFLYRDADWGTPRPTVDRVEHSASAQGFCVVLRGNIGGTIEFTTSIRCDADHLHYDVTATATADVRTNRTGLVVMHPLCA